jgi:glycosyltransferase involved in cell wall biosynthesis
MNFVKRQIDSLRSAGVKTHSIFLRSRRNVRQVLIDIIRVRAQVKAVHPDIIHAHFGTMTGFIAALTAGCLPLVVTYHGSDLNPVPSISLARSLIGRVLSQLTALRAERLICVSPELQTRLWWRRSKSVVIPTGVDLRRFSPTSTDEARSELGWNKDSYVVLFNAGKQPKVKRLDLAEDVLSRARERIGDIELRILDGRVEAAQVALMMNASNCLIVTSDWEGSPNIVKEALACGLPILSVNVGDVHSTLTDIPQCRVTATREPDHLAIELCQLLQARQRFEPPKGLTSVSTGVVASRIIDVYRAITLQAR